MKKKLFWKAFYKNLGLWNLIGLIVSIIVLIIGSILIFEEFGFKIVLENFALSYLFNKYKDFKNAVITAKKEYEIEIK